MSYGVCTDARYEDLAVWEKKFLVHKGHVAQENINDISDEERAAVSRVFIPARWERAVPEGRDVPPGTAVGLPLGGRPTSYCKCQIPNAPSAPVCDAGKSGDSCRDTCEIPCNAPQWTVDLAAQTASE